MDQTDHHKNPTHSFRRDFSVIEKSHRNVSIKREMLDRFPTIWCDFNLQPLASSPAGHLTKCMFKAHPIGFISQRLRPSLDCGWNRYLILFYWYAVILPKCMQTEELAPNLSSLLISFFILASSLETSHSRHLTGFLLYHSINTFTAAY